MSTWNGFPLAPAGSARALTAVSRRWDTMEVFWVGPDGRVDHGWWYEGGEWGRGALAAAGSAAPGAPLALSRLPGVMDLWWVAPDGSVQGAWWAEGPREAGGSLTWQRYQLAGPGSAVPGSLAGVARRHDTLEVGWVTGSGAVQGAFWYQGGEWGLYELAPAGSAAGAVAAVSRRPETMEVFWVAPDGSLDNAWWYEGTEWGRGRIAPPGSAARHGLDVVARRPETMEVFWIAPDGSLDNAWWYEGTEWVRGRIAPPGSALGADVQAVSRRPDTIEVFWAGADGALRHAWWYDGSEWVCGQIGGPAEAARIGDVTSRVPESMELWFVGTDGSLQDRWWYEPAPPPPPPPQVRERAYEGRIRSGGLAALGGWTRVTVRDSGQCTWEGHAHNSGADGYDFQVLSTLDDGAGNLVVFGRSGRVGGTFTKGSRDHDWSEPEYLDVVRATWPAFAVAGHATSTEYDSDIGEAFSDAFTLAVKWAVGTSPVGMLAGQVLFVGLAAGSLLATGSTRPGARIAEGLLWLTGPQNTLLALVADAMTSLGSVERQITDLEYDWANELVFAGSLPPREQILISDLVGPGGRQFCFPDREGRAVLHLGGDADHPMTSNPGVFVHELVHAWQLHRSDRMPYIGRGFAERACELVANPYGYGSPRKRFADFSLEQQAQVVQDWFTGRPDLADVLRQRPRDTANPFFRFVDEVRRGTTS